MGINRFKRGAFGRSGGTHVCRMCKKTTRDTGHDEAALELCKRCLFTCYVENAESDYGKDSPEHKEAIERLAALGSK